MRNMLVDFVTNVLNNGTHNATVYDEEFFEHAIHQRVAFHRNHRDLYNKLLAFCIENNLTVISTSPATLVTVVRIDL